MALASACSPCPEGKGRGSTADVPAWAPDAAAGVIREPPSVMRPTVARTCDAGHLGSGQQDEDRGAVTARYGGIYEPGRWLAFGANSGQEPIRLEPADEERVSSASH